jgi:SnoaL-like polyketide cyclase
VTAKDNKATHRALLGSLLERGEYEVIERWVSPAHRLHQTLIEPVRLGPRGLRDAVRLLRGVFRPWTVNVVDQLANDDRVLTTFVAQGKHAGRLALREASGSWGTFRAMLLTRFAADVAYESWLEADALQPMLALGIVRPRAGALIATGEVEG